jgi:deoxyribonuclease V
MKSAWGVTPKQAIEIQKDLQSHVVIKPYTGQLKRIAGADISLNLFSDIAYAGIAVFSFPDLAPISHALVKTKIKFPYIPGLLSFREIPALLEVWEKLLKKSKTKPNSIPDVIVVDGQGIAHPRSLGIATHFGMLINMPTIGSAKSVLYGEFEEPKKEAGSLSYMHDPRNKEHIIGVALRTKNRAKPVIISPGYNINLEQSLDIIKRCVRGYRIPEPIRLTHELVNKFRRGEITE